MGRVRARQEATTLEDAECEGGACPVCFDPARLVECWQCCDSAWVISCVHRSTPPTMQRGRRDGRELHRTFCAECAET
jgi:hypothetical protein